MIGPKGRVRQEISSSRTVRTAKQARPSPRSFVALGRVLLMIALCLVASLSSSGANAAELAEDVLRVEAVWASASSHVTRLAPTFLEADQVVPVRMPHAALSIEGNGCTSVAVIGSRAAEFVLDTGHNGVATWKNASEASGSTRSVAGLAVLVRCGPARAELASLAIRMRSKRGAIEVLVARGARQAPPVEPLLAERAAGPLGAYEPPGAPLVIGDLASRVARAEKNLTETRGARVTRFDLQADGLGRGFLALEASEGCHQFVIMPNTVIGSRFVHADVDVEVRERARDQVIARDRSHATDGLAEACFGEPSALRLTWVGAPARAQTVVLHAQWPLEPGLPAEWPSRTRGAIARAHFRRASPLLTQAPAWYGTGVSGRTVLGVEIEPNACYAAAVGASRGDVRVIALTVRIGARSFADTSGSTYEGGVVTFCGDGAERATLELYAAGSSLGWVAGLWRIGETRSSGEGEP